jgi:hypothetical protein
MRDIFLKKMIKISYLLSVQIYDKKTNYLFIPSKSNKKE